MGIYEFLCMSMIFWRENIDILIQTHLVQNDQWLLSIGILDCYSHNRMRIYMLNQTEDIIYILFVILAPRIYHLYRELIIKNSYYHGIYFHWESC